jgi:outer membrane protein assembly factor BamA
LKNIFAPFPLLSCLFLVLAAVGATAEESVTDNRPGLAPDIREDETKLKIQDGDTVIVPIPMSNPTLGTGLIVGGAYFYPQTEEQAKKQPASLTGAGAMYTSNDSRAFVLAQQNYWKEDRWRFTGVVGAADIRLELLAADETGDGTRIDYKVGGPILLTQLSRRLKGHWYGGVKYRLIHAAQAIEAGTDTESSDFELGDATSSGLGLTFEYDSRDLPMNSYDGAHFKIEGLFNAEALGSDGDYQSYSTYLRFYRSLTDSVVLAWEAQGCLREGSVPLWDACTVKLRGFAATDYLGESSISTQLEARWKMSKRWGVVGFAGVGDVVNSFSGLGDGESIPSYGLGIRFMVLQSKRINMRLDFARSDDSDAVYLSVGEAF